MTFDPCSTPALVLADKLWLEGSPGEPKIGDLWLLSWDQVGLGLLLLTGVEDSFVIGWPVTLDVELAMAPAMRVKSPLGVDVAIWPTRETGIGLHLLRRRFGTMLDRELIVSIGDALEGDDSELPIPFIELENPKREALAERVGMVQRWEAICYHEWPAPDPDHALLNRDAANMSGAYPSKLAEWLGVPVAVATSMFRGSRELTGEQLRIVAEQAGSPVDVLIAPNFDEGTLELNRPYWKEQVLEAGARKGEGEATARRLIQKQFVLAARNGGTREHRMNAAISEYRG